MKDVVNTLRPISSSLDIPVGNQVALTDHILLTIQTLNKFRIDLPEAFQNTPALKTSDFLHKTGVDLRFLAILARDIVAIESATDAQGAGKEAKDFILVILRLVLDEVLAQLWPEQVIEVGVVRHEILHEGRVQMFRNAAVVILCLVDAPLGED